MPTSSCPFAAVFYMHLACCIACCTAYLYLDQHMYAVDSPIASCRRHYPRAGDSPLSPSPLLRKPDPLTGVPRPRLSSATGRPGCHSCSCIGRCARRCSGRVEPDSHIRRPHARRGTSRWRHCCTHWLGRRERSCDFCGPRCMKWCWLGWRLGWRLCRVGGGMMCVRGLDCRLAQMRLRYVQR